MARASSDNLVEVLNDLGFLHLGRSRGSALADDEEAFPVDLAAERRGEDLVDPYEIPTMWPSQPAAGSPDPMNAAERRRVDLERIAERLGGGSPPRLLDPDVYAWYQPVHYFAQAWGVFVRESGMQAVALAIAEFVQSNRDPVRVAAEIQRMAHVALRLHETFHHKVESAAIRVETIAGDETYKPYDDGVFLPLRNSGSNDLLEEALANAWMFRERKSDSDGVADDVSRGFEAFLRRWIPTLPGPYGRGLELLQTGMDSHLFYLTEQLRTGRIDPPRRDRLWAITTHLHDPLHNRRSAHYIVVPRGQRPYLPHTAMPPKELSLTHRELAKHFRALGWQRTVNGGPHPIKFVKDGMPPIPVPIHAGSLPTGTLHAIARQAGFANIRELIAAARS